MSRMIKPTLRWESLEMTHDDKPTQYKALRAKVPGGWLVWHPVGGMAFIPDPGELW